MVGTDIKDRKRAAERAADSVRRSILRGDIAPGSDLPGERELSEKLGVSRLTLRSALARLEGEGLIRPVHGSGTRVLDFRKNGGIELIGHLVAVALEGGELPIALLHDLLELRLLIAVELLTLVTERATEEELAALGDHVDAQEAYVEDAAAFMTSDLEFARLLAQSGHNFAVELLVNTGVRLFEAHPEVNVAFVTNARETLSVYRRLLELIAERDPDRVNRVARRVIGRMDRTTIEQLSLLAGGARTDNRRDGREREV